jgi:hypothetical protein
VPDLLLMAEARPTEDGQPCLLTQLGLCLFPSANQMIQPLVGMTASPPRFPKIRVITPEGLGCLHGLSL